MCSKYYFTDIFLVLVLFHLRTSYAEVVPDSQEDILASFNCGTQDCKHVIGEATMPVKFNKLKPKDKVEIFARDKEYSLVKKKDDDTFHRVTTSLLQRVTINKRSILPGKGPEVQISPTEVKTQHSGTPSISQSSKLRDENTSFDNDGIQASLENIGPGIEEDDEPVEKDEEELDDDEYVSVEPEERNDLASTSVNDQKASHISVDNLGGKTLVQPSKTKFEPPNKNEPSEKTSGVDHMKTGENYNILASKTNEGSGHVTSAPVPNEMKTVASSEKVNINEADLTDSVKRNANSVNDTSLENSSKEENKLGKQQTPEANSNEIFKSNAKFTADNLAKEDTSSTDNQPDKNNVPERKLTPFFANLENHASQVKDEKNTKNDSVPKKQQIPVGTKTGENVNQQSMPSHAATLQTNLEDSKIGTNPGNIQEYPPGARKGAAPLHPAAGFDVDSALKKTLQKSLEQTKTQLDPELIPNVTENKTDPAIANETKTDPLIVNESKTDPAIINDTKTDPAIVNETKTDPAIVNDTKTDLGIVNETKTDLGIVNETKTDPAIVNETKTDPAIVNDIKTDPGIVNETKPDLGIVHEAKADPGIVHDTKTDPAIVNETKTDPAIVNDTKTDPGIVNETKTNPAIVNDTKTDPGIVNETKTDPGIVHEAKADPGLVHETKADPGIFNETKTDPGIVHETKTDSRIVNEIKTQPAVTPETTVEINPPASKSATVPEQKLRKHFGHVEMIQKHDVPPIQHLPQEDAPAEESMLLAFMLDTWEDMKHALVDFMHSNEINSIWLSENRNLLILCYSVMFLMIILVLNCLSVKKCDNIIKGKLYVCEKKLLEQNAEKYKIQEILEENSEATTQLDELTQENERQKTNLDLLTSKINELNGEQETLRSSVNEYKRKYESLQEASNKKNIKKNYELLMGEVIVQKKKLDEFAALMEERAEVLKQEKENIESLLKVQAEEHSKVVNDYRMLLNNVELENKELRDIVQTVSVDNDATQKLLEAASLQVQLLNLEKENENLSNQLAGEREAHKLLEDHQRMTQKEVNELRDTCEVAVKEKTDLSNKLKYITDYFQQLEDKLKKEIAAKDDLLNEKLGDDDSLAKALMNLRKENCVLNEENSILRSKYESLKVELTDQKNEEKLSKTKLENEREQIWMEWRAAERKIESLNLDNKVLRSKLVAMGSKSETSFREMHTQTYDDPDKLLSPTSSLFLDHTSPVPQPPFFIPSYAIPPPPMSDEEMRRFYGPNGTYDENVGGYHSDEDQEHGFHPNDHRLPPLGGAYSPPTLDNIPVPNIPPPLDNDVLWKLQKMSEPVNWNNMSSLEQSNDEEGPSYTSSTQHRRRNGDSISSVSSRRSFV